MKGLYLHKAAVDLNAGDESQWLKLLAKKGNFEVMTQRVIRGATAWLYPAQDSNDLEFYFVHSGAMEIVISENNVHRIGPGVRQYHRNRPESPLLF